MKSMLTVRFCWAVLLVLVVLVAAAATALAATTISIEVNGRVVATDVAPVNMSGRVMVPIRFVAEALGAEVSWDGMKQTVRIKTPDAGGPATNASGGMTFQPNFDFRNVSLVTDIQGVRIVGEIVNQTGGTRRYVTVRAKFYDASGRPVGGTDHRPVQPETLADGEAGRFEILVPSYLRDSARFDLTAAYLD